MQLDYYQKLKIATSQPAGLAMMNSNFTWQFPKHLQYQVHYLKFQYGLTFHNYGAVGQVTSSSDVADLVMSRNAWR